MVSEPSSIRTPAPPPPEQGTGWVLANSLLIALLLTLAFWFFYLRLLEPPDGVSRIDAMSFSEALPVIEPDAAETSVRPLPDDWLKTSPDTVSGWYSARVYIDDAVLNHQAIYLPVLHMNADIYFDDTLVGRSFRYSGERRRGDPYVREISRPTYFRIPDTLATPGAHRLLIHVDSPIIGAGLLGPVYVGDDAPLQKAYENRYAARITTVRLISAGMLSIAIFMSVLWWLRREDSIYGWFALLVYTWTLHNIFFLGLELPFPAWFKDWITLLTLGWFVVFMVITTHRYLNLRPRRLERAIMVTGALGSLLLLPAYALQLAPLGFHRAWSTLVIALGSYGIYQAALAYRSRKDIRNPFVLPAGLSILIPGTHDWLVVTGLWPRDGGLLLHFSAPVTLIVFGSLLLERFSGVLRNAESLNQELESRVEEKHRILEKNFRKLREMEKQKILAEERSRFMKEMHDGVGGHLVSMLSMIRAGEKDPDRISAAIGAALNDLRLMIDSLDPDEPDIPTLLGAMRSRLEPQLANGRLRFEWRVREIPPLPDFGPRKALQVMRILQEAVTNVINHADARLICIDVRMESNGKRVAILDITDDGKGFPPQVIRGHGLDNMLQRAHSLGATLDIQPANPGTRVSLSLPYD